MKPKKIFSSLLLVCVLILSYTISIETHVIYHENAHKQIYRYFGCENVTIGTSKNIFGLINSGNCSCNNHQFSEEEIMHVMHLHAMNEIVGYHFRAFTDAIFLVAMFIIAFYVFITIDFTDNNDKD